MDLRGKKGPKLGPQKPRLITLWCQPGGHSYTAICTTDGPYTPIYLGPHEICPSCIRYLWRCKPDTFRKLTCGEAPSMEVLQ